MYSGGAGVGEKGVVEGADGNSGFGWMLVIVGLVIAGIGRIVQSSKVVLTIYYVTISDEQHAELSPCLKLLHSRLYLVIINDLS